MPFFFFQAEDGIRDKLVTGVQTCALPIYRIDRLLPLALRGGEELDESGVLERDGGLGQHGSNQGQLRLAERSEEHTSELQSLAYLVCRLLLEKKKRRRYGRHLRAVWWIGARAFR